MHDFWRKFSKIFSGGDTAPFPNPTPTLPPPIPNFWIRHWYRMYTRAAMVKPDPLAATPRI